MWEIGFRLFVGAQFILYYIGNMIRFLFYILLAGFFLSSCTQKSSNEVHSATNDSVKKYLDLAWDDTIAFDKRVKYNDKALSFIDLKKNDSLSLLNIYRINTNLSIR